MDEVAALRSFNRAWTQRVGALDDSFLGTGRPLGPSRVLFEIGPAGVGVGELRDRLGLDAGYLSRLLRRLERDGLVATAADPDDARRRVATLTAAGHEAWRELETRSDEVARRILAPLSASKRARLADALHTADGLVRAATAEFVEVDAASAPAQAAMTEYFAELARRFPSGFDATGYLQPEDYNPPNGRFFVAVSDGEVIGCGGLVWMDATAAEIKRMWIDPAWRGWGLATRLLRHLEQTALAAGYRVTRLDTNPVLLEAIAMYRGAGYRDIARYNDNPYAGLWFEKDLAALP
jgi:DNA-binding MarR family transcriptional regulator/GNAT superfamily N-acetyltransferase